MAKPVHSAVMLAFCVLGTSAAYATCTATIDTYTCSSPPIDSSDYRLSFSTAATGSATGWTLTGGELYAYTYGGNNTFTGNNITATNAGVNGTGVIHIAAMPGSNGNVLATINNSSIQTTGFGAHGLTAHANNTVGNATLNVNNTSVSMAASVGGTSGLVVVAQGSGKATLNTDNANVTSANVGSAVQVVSISGSAEANLIGGTITSTGNGSTGLYTYAGGTGTLKVDSSAIITTSGSSAHGIYGEVASGTANITNRGAITTGGAGAYGIYGTAVNGSVDLSNSNTITTSGSLSHGMYANMTGTGSATITNTGNVTSNGVAAAMRIDTASGNATINQNGGDIKINGALDSGALYAITNGAGIATVNMNGGTVENNSTVLHGHGLEARAQGSGDAVVNLTAGTVTTYGGLGLAAWNGIADGGTGNIKITTSAGTVINALGSTGSGNPGGIYARGGSAALGTTVKVDSQSAITANTIGIEASSNKSADVVVKQTGGSINAGAMGIYGHTAGNINIANSGIIQTASTDGYGIVGLSTGGTVTIDNQNAITTTGDGAHDIFAAATGLIDISNSASIVAQGNFASGIVAQQNGTAGINVRNTGAVTTHGTNGAGIFTSSSSGGDTSVTNNGVITTQGDQARGIYVFTNSGTTDITSSGNITTAGSTLSGGILVNSSSAKISSDISGNITTAGTFSPAIELISSRNAEGTASNLLNYHNGVATVGAGSNAVSLWAGGAATGSGEVRIGSGAVIDASRGLSAVQNLMPGDSLINIDAGAQITGGSGAGAALGGLRGTLNNAGTVGAMSDLAIYNGGYPVNSQSIAVNNQSSGLVTGYITLGNGSASMTNSGEWNLRNVADTTGNGIRDTLAVAVSNFGTSGNNSINNSGTIALLGDNGVASTLNNTGAYATGYAANTMALGGAVQGQILNVQTFTNSGTIDMGPANAAVGDVLVISGGATPGVSGGGVYIANGGKLLLDTVLNEGGANSQSDMLILDTTRLGSGATAININNVGGSGALTNGDGIELVRVLDNTNSAAKVFKLDNRVVSGIYEYDLYQGGVGTHDDNGNWYLRTLALPDNGGGDNGGSPPAPRPETGVYLRNLTAGSTMFMHTLHDRLGEPQYTDAYKGGTDGKVSSLWLRVVGNHSEGNAADGQIDMTTNTSLVHMGGDLARWSSDGNDRWQVGLMGAYGKSDTDADPVAYKRLNNGMLRTANGSVNGYSVGAYATWYGNKDKPTGPYLDTWAQYGLFNNSVQGNGLKEEKYDSNGWTASVEGGYAFNAHESETRQWMIEPQAQLAYNSYSADDHQEANGTWVRNGDSNGIIARLGARLYSRSKLGDNGIQPFVEANWWYGSAKNDLTFNGVVVSDGTPDNTFELKAGLQGEIAKGWQVWGHIGGRWGDNNYSSYEGMVGVKHQF